MARDILSKISNTQYMAVTMLEAPVLAIIVAGFLRYISPESATGEYVLRDNTNLVSYLFISVVVALFLGLSVSAEEIIKDRKIRKRESFLNLSRAGYLSSKILIQFTISAIQMFTYIVIGNALMGIEGMNFTYWIILFSAACTSNLIGLNISSSFKNVVTIYILIPFIIITQILFSGVLVKYNQLNPWFAAQRGVPIIGNIMASRWTFEALAVEQVSHNKYEKNFFEINKKLYHFYWMKTFWLSEIDGSLSALKNDLTRNENSERVEYELALIQNEFKELPAKEIASLTLKLDQLTTETIKPEHIDILLKYTRLLNGYYSRKIDYYQNLKDSVTAKLRVKYDNEKGLLDLKSKHENEELWEYVNNKKSLTKIKEINGELYRNENLLYMTPKENINHLYGSEKSMFGRVYKTFWFNIVVLWLITLLLSATLYFDFLTRFFWALSKIKISKKNK